MFKNMAFALLIVLSLVAVNVQGFNYIVPYYDNSISGASLETDPVSFSTVNGNTAIIDQTLGFFTTAVPVSNYTVTFESPFDTIFAVASGDISTNNTCFDIGTGTKSYETTEIEGRNTITQDGHAGNFISTKNQFNVTTSERYLNITNLETDTEGFAYNMFFTEGTYAGSSPSNADITDNFNVNNFGICKNLVVARNTTPTIAVGNGNRREFAYLVFNSTAGNVSWFVDPISWGDVRATIYRLSDLSVVDTQLVPGVWRDSNVNLQLNTLYVLGVGGEHGSVATINTPILEVLIDVGLPDYDCDDWSKCIDASQNRECVDLNGFQPNLIQSRPCDLTILENATLGFEEFFSTSDVLKCVPGWTPGCPYSITNVTLDRPVNWTVVDPAYGFANFLQMTQEYATEGTRSLKMWQIPPKQDSEVIDNVTCGDLSVSVVPQVFQGVSNDTFSVSHNVTFPATNMQIGFDVKKCPSQVVQHTELRDFLNLTLFGFCPQVCYGFNCSSEPRGRYAFNVRDTVTGASLFGSAQYNDASLSTKTLLYDISNLGIIPGRTYNIAFFISNENPNDATGNCVYFDNVNYQVSEQTIETVVPDCVSICRGTTRIEASLTPSGSCFIVEQTPSPLCTDQATGEAIENQEDYCSSTSVLQSFSEKSGGHSPISCEEGFLCDPFPVLSGTPGSCITEEEVPTDPTDTKDASNIVTDFLEILSTDMGVSLALIVVLTLASAVGLGRLGAKNELVPLAVGLVVTIGLAGFNKLPIEIGAIISLVFAFLILHEYRKAK